MVLGDTVLFPNAIMPLYIFEDRYREMLTDCLASHRLFAVFNRIETGTEEECPCAIGTVGVIRAAHKNKDGTSNLVVQGLARVRWIRPVDSFAYPAFEVESVSAEDDGSAASQQRELLRSLLEKNPVLTSNLPEDYLSFLHDIDDPEVFLDVCAYGIVPSPENRQKLLETPTVAARYEILMELLRSELAQFKLFKKLQGQTRDEEIDLN